VRILVIPAFLGTNLAGDSYASLICDFIRWANEKDYEKHWFYVILPKGFDDSVFTQFRNVTLVYEDREMSPGTFYSELETVPYGLIEHFSVLKGIYPVDVVLNVKVGASPQIYRMLNQIVRGENDAPAIPLVNFEPRAIARTRPTYHVRTEAELASRAVSYALFKSVFISQVDYEDAIDGAREYLSPEMLKRMKENAVLLPVGLDFSFIDKLTEGVKKREKFSLFWGGRLTAQKRLWFVLEQYLRLFESGKDVDIVLTTPVSGGKLKNIAPYFKRFKGLTLRTNVGREEYLRTAKSCHVFFYAGIFDSFSVGVCEVASLGVPTIVKRTEGMKQMFGANYELMYDTASEGAALLWWVYDNYEKALEIAEKAKKRVREQFSSSFTHLTLMNLLREEYVNAVFEKAVIAPLTGRTRDSMNAFIYTLRNCCGDSTIDFFTALKLFKRFYSSEIGKNPKNITPWELYQGLKICGAKDLYDGPVPVFDVREVRPLERGA